MSDFGDIRSAVHNNDLRALIEASYRKRRYALQELHERYIQDMLPEYEHEVWVWARAMVDHLLEHTNVPHVMVRAFAATWAEWMRAGAVGHMLIDLKGSHTSITAKWYPGGYDHLEELEDKVHVLRQEPIRYDLMDNLHSLGVHNSGFTKQDKRWMPRWKVDYKSVCTKAGVIRDERGQITKVICHNTYAQVFSTRTKRIASCRVCKAMWRIETGELEPLNFLGR